MFHCNQCLWSIMNVASAVINIHVIATEICYISCINVLCMDIHLAFIAFVTNRGSDFYCDSCIINYKYLSFTWFPLESAWLSSFPKELLFCQHLRFYAWIFVAVCSNILRAISHIVWFIMYYITSLKPSAKLIGNVTKIIKWDN